MKSLSYQRSSSEKIRSGNEQAKEVLQGETVPTVLNAFVAKLESMETFDEPSILAAIKEVQKETGVKGKNLFMPIRVATSGQTHGAGDRQNDRIAWKRTQHCTRASRTCSY